MKGLRKVYSDVAKKRNLSCGVSTTKVQTSNQTTQSGSNLDSCKSNPNKCSSKELCSLATFKSDGQTYWMKGLRKVYSDAAKKRNLSCGVSTTKTKLQQEEAKRKEIEEEMRADEEEARLASEAEKKRKEEEEARLTAEAEKKRKEEEKARLAAEAKTKKQENCEALVDVAAILGLVEKNYSNIDGCHGDSGNMVSLKNGITLYYYGREQRLVLEPYFMSKSVICASLITKQKWRSNSHYCD